MTRQSDQYSKIPLTLLAEGIMYGPYPAAPTLLVEHYLSQRALVGYEDLRSEEQFVSDIQSEWQYDQHCEAVLEASLARRISPEHSLFMQEKVLRPWFVGRRNADEV